MSEWLTTGQMVDRLKVGEMAENGVKGRVIKDKRGIMWVNELNEINYDRGHYGYVVLGQPDELKWRILAKFVTFEEAMKALKEGKTVTYHEEHPEQYTLDLKLNWDVDALSGLSFEDLFKPRWTIEEE